MVALAVDRGYREAQSELPFTYSADDESEVVDGSVNAYFQTLFI